MMSEGFYFFEPFSDNFSRAFKIDKLYYQGKTKYQFIQCFCSQHLGKVLFIDDKIQSAQIDEFVYHESLVHPGLHRGYFALPLYLMKNLKKGKILTDKKPFIWKL